MDTGCEGCKVEDSSAHAGTHKHTHTTKKELLPSLSHAGMTFHRPLEVHVHLFLAGRLVDFAEQINGNTSCFIHLCRGLSISRSFGDQTMILVYNQWNVVDLCHDQSHHDQYPIYFENSNCIYFGFGVFRVQVKGFRHDPKPQRQQQQRQ